MHLDVVDLRAFYATDLGGVVRRIVAHRIRSRWRRADGQVVMGLGFAAPYLAGYRGEALRLGALMPAAQGALVWPATGTTNTVMVDEHNLPLPDNSVDKLLAVHALEFTESARPLLREMWRVLQPEGRLLLIVPNRRGVWSRRETTPLGHGQPYSRAQLERLLADAMFTPTEWSSALHMPPINRRFLVRWAMAFERLGSRFWPSFAGIIIVEAQKELMAPVGKAEVVRRGRTLATAAAGPTRRESGKSRALAE
jgi:SAM-dependent methyltransferase